MPATAGVLIHSFVRLNAVSTGVDIANVLTMQLPRAMDQNVDPIKETNVVRAFRESVAVLPGVVFAGAMDGRIRAYDAGNGKIIWDFDTGATFDSVNGVKGHGGAIDYGGQVIAHGMLFVISGSMRQSGNLLLAFSPE